jgi:predicted nucleic acid-binding protein
MQGKQFFDTNILIYAVAQDDPRTSVAENLLTEGGVVSVQVLNEFAAVARRKLGMPWKDVTEALHGVRILCPDPVALTIATHEVALRIAARHDYRIYDALIIAAALQAGCDILCTEDMQDGHVIDRRLTIRNPFAA